ncbi:hypothetical protein RND81_10G171200 [Saponaria officinalis]|uniref:GATA-type domain-containing protein n=1 Tax=Saponaria officinalis TaxID=3572 RepID=A0AAW1I5L3_SAPOF
MSPVYMNPQQSSSLSFLELKSDPILGYLHDHVTSTNNNHAYFSCSSFENRPEFIAMEYSRRAQDQKVVEKLFQSHDKLTISSTQPQNTTSNGSGCSYIHQFDEGDPKIETTKTNQKPKKLKPTKLKIMQRVTETENPKKMKVEYKLHHHDHVVQPQRSNNENNSSHGFLRMCSDCHTTTTPLWRSGPQGPKSLCNACGIRQRKARRAAMAAAAAAADFSKDTTTTVTSPLSSTTTTTTTTTTTFQSPKPIIIDEEIRSKLNLHHEKNHTLPLKKRSKTLHFSSFNNNNNSNNNDNNNINDNNNNNNNNYYYNSSSQREFPRDEEEGAILLMALSCGLACSS